MIYYGMAPNIRKHILPKYNIDRKQAKNYITIPKFISYRLQVEMLMTSKSKNTVHGMLARATGLKTLIT